MVFNFFSFIFFFEKDFHLKFVYGTERLGGNSSVA